MRIRNLKYLQDNIFTLPAESFLYHIRHNNVSRWLGNTDLLISIIKLIEDKMNLEHDVNAAGVQMILLVEDSIRYYSSITP